MGLEKVTDGVWLLRGDFRGAMNIYFLEDGDGVIAFDAGTKAMRRAARPEAAQLGGLKKVVLGHAHADHRGSAPYLGVPVYCHPDEVADAESDAAIAAYMDLSQLPVAPIRWLYRFLLPHWDGGAVRIAGTVIEGDEVAGFEVIHFPGHAPGLIGLWRESDRVAIVSDVVYLVDSARLQAAARGRGQRPPPRLGLEPRQGEGFGAPPGRAGTEDRLHRARSAAARRQPPRDPGKRRRAVLIPLSCQPDDRDLRLGGVDLRRLAAGGSGPALAGGAGGVVVAGAGGRLRRGPDRDRGAGAGAWPRQHRDGRRRDPGSSPRSRW